MSLSYVSSLSVAFCQCRSHLRFVSLFFCLCSSFLLFPFILNAHHIRAWISPFLWGVALIYILLLCSLHIHTSHGLHISFSLLPFIADCIVSTNYECRTCLAMRFRCREFEKRVNRAGGHFSSCLCAGTYACRLHLVQLSWRDLAEHHHDVHSLFLRDIPRQSSMHWGSRTYMPLTPISGMGRCLELVCRSGNKRFHPSVCPHRLTALSRSETERKPRVQRSTLYQHTSILAGPVVA